MAPRNFLVGMVQTYQPGGFFAYPPLHMLILTILTLPGWLLAILHARSFAQHDIVQAFIQVPTMTGFAVVARSVSVIMSLSIIHLIGRMTSLVANPRAGMFAASACALNAVFTYYSQVSNLDVPYLFWAVLSLSCWMRLIAEHDPARIRGACLCAAASIATKDQAYAVFVFAIPAGLGLWFALDRWPRLHVRDLATRLSVWSVAALLGLLAIDGAMTNPAGFLRRIAFLAGPASQDYAQYEPGLRGWLALLADAGQNFTRVWPLAVAGLAVLGLAKHVAGVVRGAASRSPGMAALAEQDGSLVAARAAAQALPILAALSFTVAFNFVALRSENRFLLPQSVLLAVPIGLGTDILTRRATRAGGRFGAAQARPALARPALAGQAVTGLLGLMALRLCLGIDEAMLRDPRYDAERWMAENVRPGETIEALGPNAFLPRFPPAARVSRLDRKALAARNPLPGVQEIEAPLEAFDRTRPHYVVVSAFWLNQYRFGPADAAGDGRFIQPVRRRLLADGAAAASFGSLVQGERGYLVAHLSRYAAGPWPVPEGFESLGQTIWIFARDPGR